MLVKGGTLIEALLDKSRSQRVIDASDDVIRTQLSLHNIF